MTDKYLDDAIDRAVREMMDVEPRPGMRQRVFARLDEPRNSILTAPRLATAAAVLAALLVLTFMIRSSERAPDAIVVQDRPPAAATGASMEPRDVEPKPTQAVYTRAKVTTPRKQDIPVRAASVDTVETTDGTVRIEPMTPMEPISIAKLEPEPIVSGEIRIKPLTIEQIEIAPLTPPR